MQLKRGHLFRWLLAVLLVAPLLATAPALAAGVVVEGNIRVDTETIESYFTGSDPAAVNQGVKNLYATGQFSDIQVLHEGGRVIIRVKENILINRVVFEGNATADHLEQLTELLNVQCQKLRAQEIRRRAEEAAMPRKTPARKVKAKKEQANGPVKTS